MVSCSFSCEAFVHVPKQKERNGARKVKRFSYPENFEGYKIYFKDTHSMEFCRDAIFKKKEKIEFINKYLTRESNENEQTSNDSNDEENQDSERDVSFYQDTEEEEADTE